jgi:hypothetical protein
MKQKGIDMPTSMKKQLAQGIRWKIEELKKMDDGIDEGWPQ